MSTSPITLDFSKAQSLQRNAPGNVSLDFSKAQNLEWKPQKKYLPGREFGMEVAKGMGLDAEKIKNAEDEGGQEAALKEIGSQVFEGLSGFASKVVHDPFNIAQPIHGMASSVEQAIKEKSPGQLMGAVSTILGGAQAKETASTAASAAREGIGEAIHTPEGELTPGAKLAGKVAGGAAGAGIGSLVGHEYLGAAAGYKLGPSLIDTLFPESEASSAARETFQKTKEFTEAQEAAQKMNEKFDKAKAVAARIAARNAPKAPTPSPFEGMTPSTAPAGSAWESGTPQGSPTLFPQKNVQMVEKFSSPEPSRIQQPGSTPPNIKVTYQSVPGVQLLEKVMKGDAFAIREWQRRGLPLPANVKFMVEGGAGTTPWRNPEQ